MDLRALEHNDIHSIVDLQPPGWQEFIPNIEFYTSSDFCFPIKVTINNKIIGIGTSILHHNIAWLAAIIVHPDYRNRGIGKLITQSLIDSLQAKGCETIYLIATDLGEPVYNKLGFETETEYLCFKDIQLTNSWKRSENIVAYSNGFKMQVATIDRAVTGEKRMNHLESHLTHGYLYVENNLVEGFYLPTFGEGFIAAKTSSAGIELMKVRLSANKIAIFPIDNSGANEFMHQNNFKEYKAIKRMRLGKKRAWQPKNIYNRIGGNLG